MPKLKRIVFAIFALYLSSSSACFAARGRQRAVDFCRAFLEASAESLPEMAERRLVVEIGKTGVFRFPHARTSYAHELKALKRYVKFRGGHALSTDGFLADVGVPIVDAVYFGPSGMPVRNLSLKVMNGADTDRRWFFRTHVKRVCASVRQKYSHSGLGDLLGAHGKFLPLCGPEVVDSPFPRGLIKLFGLTSGADEVDRPLELVLDLASIIINRAEITVADTFDKEGSLAFSGDVFLNLEERSAALLNLSALSRQLQGEPQLERMTLLLGRQAIEIESGGVRMHDLASRRVLAGSIKEVDNP